MITTGSKDQPTARAGGAAVELFIPSLNKMIELSWPKAEELAIELSHAARLIREGR